MRASYRAAVDWIARNDNAGAGDATMDIADYLTTVLVADIFGKHPNVVAIEVKARRDDIAKAEGRS